MNKLSKILWNIFTSMAVFACCNSANADTAHSTNIVSRPEETHTLCRAGYYVSKCGNHTVGTNWLKGYPDSPNYYDYSGANNLKNLRYFFSDNTNAEIIYTTSSGARQVVGYSTYKDTRNNLLAATCNPVNVQISCSPCPGMATVPESTVDISRGSDLVISGSWNFHTIADCYMQEFTDSTGVFEYVDNYQDKNTQNCYYANDVAGDALTSENTAPNSQYNQE